jgi:hypothetical protein
VSTQTERTQLLQHMRATRREIDAEESQLDLELEEIIRNLRTEESVSPETVAVLFQTLRRALSIMWLIDERLRKLEDLAGAEK